MTTETMITSFKHGHDIISRHTFVNSTIIIFICHRMSEQDPEYIGTIFYLSWRHCGKSDSSWKHLRPLWKATIGNYRTLHVNCPFHQEQLRTSHGDHLGTILGLSCNHLGPILKTAWIRKPSWDNLATISDHLRTILEQSWDHLATISDHVSTILKHN
jgi:hypothetical protein